MKTYKFTIKTILAGMFAWTILVFPQKSYAQFAVIDPAAIAQFAEHITLQTAWEVAREAYSRTVAAASASAITASTDAVRATQGIQIKQAEFNQKDTDQRYRKAMGEQAIAQRDIRAMPTVARCVELTAALGRSAASSASRASGGRVSSSIENRLTRVNSFGGSAAESIALRQELNTCTPFEVANKITQCGSVGKYPGGDHKAQAIFVNMDTSKSKTSITVDGNPEKVPGANYTLDAKGQEVAERYIGNLVTAKAPLMLTPAQAKKAPGYMSLYYAVTTRIDTATNALRNIAAWKYEPSAAAANSAAYQGFLGYWNANKSKYEDMFGDQFTWPARPSEYEMLHFEIMKNYADVMGTKTANSVTDGGDTDKQILEQAIMNNYLSWIKIKQAEDTNALLATMLANQLSPVPPDQLETERLKAQSAPK